MALDPKAISPAAYARYVHVGEGYGSTATLAQADAHLDALKTHGPALAAHGFAAKDQSKLADARDGLLAAGVQRAGARTDSAVKRASHGDVLGEAKQERTLARTVLQGARGDLFESAAPAAQDGVKLIDGALQQTATSGADAAALLEQLSILESTLKHPAIAAAAADRGGPAAVAGLGKAIGALKTTARPQKRGTPEHTELLNFYDGVIVELCRSARRSARAAAKKLGSPAIADAFALNHLVRGGSSEDDAGAPPGGPGGGAPPNG